MSTRVWGVGLWLLGVPTFRHISMLIFLTSILIFIWIFLLAPLASLRLWFLLRCPLLPFLPLLLLLLALSFLLLLQFLLPLFRSLLLILFPLLLHLWLRGLLCPFAPLTSASPAAPCFAPPTPSLCFPSASAPLFAHSFGGTFLGVLVVRRFHLLRLLLSVQRLLCLLLCFSVLLLRILPPLFLSSAPPPPASTSVPSFSSSDFAFPGSSLAPFVPAFAHGHANDLPDDVPPYVLPRDLDSAAPAAVPESACSEFRHMLVFVVDLFPQAAGSPSAPPARALFEDFFGSSAPPSSLVFLNWVERVRTALSDADT